MLGKVGYGESSDNNDTGSCVATLGTHCTWWGAAGTVQHKPTGLFVYGGYGEHTDDDIKAATLNPAAEDKNTTWFIQAGIEQKFIPLGKTTVFGEYRNDNAGRPWESQLDRRWRHGGGTEVDFWAAGIVQNVEAAAMDVYMIYRHADGEVTGTNGAKVNLDDFDMLMAGARIQF